jgi:hypothetical protein
MADVLTIYTGTVQPGEAIRLAQKKITVRDGSSPASA